MNVSRSLGKLILGTVQLGLSYGINNSKGKPTKNEAFEILEEAHKQGIKYLDTAAAYGNSEEVIGSFHSSCQKHFSILTKFHASGDDKISILVSSALERLNVSKIEVLFFHSYQDFKAHPNMLIDLLQEVKAGRINKIGVSVYTNQEIEDLLDFDDVKVIQAPFNLLDNDSKRAKIFKRAKASGKEIHTRSAFLQGLFFKDPESLPEKLSPIKRHLKKITDLAKSSNLSIASLALNYALSKSYIDRVLIGVDNVQQLKSNMEVIEQTLPLHIAKEIDQIEMFNTRLLNPAEWSK
jgi:aryl-alcohol dehydrogenase-like predicted oxidoreductase